VQAIREERTRTHGSPIMTEAGWLSGAVWCEECKQKVWHQKSGRQAALRYYRCSGINKRVCHVAMARAETLESEMLAILGMLTIPSDLAAAVVAEARQLGNAEEVAPPPPDRGGEQKLVQLQQAYDGERDRHSDAAGRCRAALGRASTGAVRMFR